MYLLVIFDTNPTFPNLHWRQHVKIMYSKQLTPTESFYVWKKNKRQNKTQKYGSMYHVISRSQVNYLVAFDSKVVFRFVISKGCFLQITRELSPFFFVFGLQQKCQVVNASSVKSEQCHVHNKTTMLNQTTTHYEKQTLALQSHITNKQLQCNQSDGLLSHSVLDLHRYTSWI